MKPTPPRAHPSPNAAVWPTTLQRRITFAVAALAIYGDLFKRVLPATLALTVIYAGCGFILWLMVRGRSAHDRAAGNIPIASFAKGLVILYVVQLATTFSAPIIPAIAETLYVCLPLAYLIVIPKYHPQFDLKALTFYVGLFMIPINAVGLVQYFVDPNFLISTAYSEEGGVVIRNFLDRDAFGVSETFRRFPSLFASADRYSGVSMMYFFLSVLSLDTEKPSLRRPLAWSIFGILSGILGLAIAGARSRILIVSIVTLTGGLIFLFLRRKDKRARTARVSQGLVIAALVGAIFFATAFYRNIAGIASQATETFAVVRMLSQTLARNDVASRVDQSIEVSSISDNASFFGQGLGTDGNGRPGEFAIRAMWNESGFFWTILMLLMHMGIMFCIWRRFALAVRARRPPLVLVTLGTFLAYLFAVIAGLSSSFELSQGLLLFPLIAVLQLSTSPVPDRRRVPRRQLVAEDS